MHSGRHFFNKKKINKKKYKMCLPYQNFSDLLPETHLFLCPQSRLSGHIVFELCVQLSVCSSLIRVRSISPILFKVRIPNSIHLWSQSVASYFWVTVTLTSDLNSRKIVSLGAFVTLVVQMKISYDMAQYFTKCFHVFSGPKVWGRESWNSSAPHGSTTISTDNTSWKGLWSSQG